MLKDTGLDDLNIIEMIDLIHVPEVNRKLAEKLEEWKGDGFKSYMVDYEEQFTRYYMELYDAPLELMKQTGEDKHSRLYWFEFQQYAVGDWRMMRFMPWAGYYHYQYKMVPQDVIEQLDDALVKPGRVVTMNGVYSKRMKKKIDLQIVRYSGSHIFGTAKEKIEETVDWAGDLKTAFQTVYLYRETFPDIVNPFAAAFLSQLKEEETDEETGTPEPGETGPEEIQVEDQETTDADSSASASTAESGETRKKG
ncbi:MAG: hypothetical protein GY940_44300, partial [bacterium]|nr:hypothetical protein [bacterium]